MADRQSCIQAQRLTDLKSLVREILFAETFRLNDNFITSDRQVQYLIKTGVIRRRRLHNLSAKIGYRDLRPRYWRSAGIGHISDDSPRSVLGAHNNTRQSHKKKYE